MNGSLDLVGTHGTTVSRYESIGSDGFKCRNSGLRGAGAYFWVKSAYAEELAVGWYLKCIKAGTFSKNPDKRCVVITASFDVLPEQYLDIESDEVKSIFLNLIKQHNAEDSRECSEKFYDLFIELMEKELDVIIKLYKVRAYAPTKALPNCYPTQLAGSPLCYVARDSQCILINGAKTLENVGVKNEKQREGKGSS